MPSGRRQSVTMTLRSEPSVLIAWIRPPLTSRTNSRPTAALRTDLGFDFELVVRASVTWHLSMSVCSQRLRGRCRFQRPVEIRPTLLQEGRKCLLCIIGANSRAELLVLCPHCRLDLLAKRPLHDSLGGLQSAERLHPQLPRC